MTLNKSKCTTLRIKFRHPVKFLFHVGNINWINYCAGFAHDQNVAFSQRCVCGVTFILKALFSELLSDSRQFIPSSALALVNPMEQTVAKKNTFLYFIIRKTDRADQNNSRNVILQRYIQSFQLNMLQCDNHP